MDYKFIDIKSKDYSSYRVETQSAMNYSEYRLNHQETYLKRFLKDNRKDFTRILGKQTFTWRGEFNYKCWAIEYRNAKFILLTAKGYGTACELLTRVNNEGVENSIDDVIEFVNWITSEIGE